MATTLNTTRLDPFNDLGSLVRSNALRDPDRVAVKVVDGAALTYGELDQRSSRLANALLGLGLEPGERVGAWMEDVVEYVEAYVAVAKANLVMVPINARLTHHEASYQLERTSTRALIYTGAQAERVEELTVRDELKLIAAGIDGPARGADLERLRGEASPEAPPAPAPEDPFMIGFTSGSTGRPKGAVLTHRSTMTMAVTQGTALRIPLYGVNIQAVSMSFPATVVSHLMSHLLQGGTQVLTPGKWDSERIISVIEREGGTSIYVPAPVVVEFTDVAKADPRRWQTLTGVLHAGSRADPKLLELLADTIGPRYIEGWGMTEISGGVGAATTPVDAIVRRPNFFETVGRPVPGTRVKIVDEERNPLPPGREAIGEIAVHSASLFAGYWDDPEASAAVVEDGWYYSGDLGAIDEEGYIFIADRGKNLIRSGGMNVYPAEIELTLERCPGVAESAVVGAPHPQWGEAPVAVVVAEPGAELDEAAVIDFVTERLASYKKPTRVLFVEELPRTTDGKIVRQAVRDIDAADGDDDPGPAA